MEPLRGVNPDCILGEAVLRGSLETVHWDERYPNFSH